MSPMLNGYASSIDPAELRGKRVFKRAPLHHHFEEIGWAETQVVTRFWLVGIGAAVLGVAFALAVPA